MRSDPNKDQEYGEESPPLTDEELLDLCSDDDYEALNSEDLEWINKIPPPDDVWYPTIVGDNTSAEPVETSLKQQGNDASDAAKRMKEALVEREKLRNQQFEEANKQRKHFFIFVMAIVAVPTVAASLGFFILVLQAKVTDAIAVAFFASVVAEVIGLALVLANYLFPKGAGAIMGDNKSEIEVDRPTGSYLN
ncbi:hypothetical protein FRC0316_00127 [Corynebacterium diphtheriae]|nr:hypothetical protein FRC0316_00127 [Corynebacterium diphtheriae]